MKRSAVLMGIFFLLACSTKERTRENPPSSDSITIVDDSVTDATVVDNPETSSDSIYTRYVHQDSEASQAVDIYWITDDSIRFKLSYKNMLCDYNERGLAVNKYPGMDGESDEDETGLMYFSTEYQVVDGGQLFSIRVETPERTKAKISYSYNGKRDECDPEEKYIMRKKATSRD